MWFFIFFCLAYVILLGKYDWAGGAFLYIVLGIIVIVFLRCVFSSRGRKKEDHSKTPEEREQEILYDNDNLLTHKRIQQNSDKHGAKK